jgi:hypothetical protein
VTVVFRRACADNSIARQVARPPAGYVISVAPGSQKEISCKGVTRCPLMALLVQSDKPTRGLLIAE